MVPTADEADSMADEEQRAPETPAAAGVGELGMAVVEVPLGAVAAPSAGA